MPATGGKSNGAAPVHVTVGDASTVPDVPDVPDVPEDVPDELPSVVPLTVIGQHTSLSPGFVGLQPAATAISVCSGSQSSFRGRSACAEQSGSVSAPGFALHGTVFDPVPPALPHEPDSHAPLPEHDCALRDELHVIENELPANVMSHAPVSPLPRSPVTLALLPVTVPDPLAPSSHSTERLQLLLCVTSHDVLVHEPLSFQRPLKSFAQPLAPVPTVVDVHATITAQAPSVTTMPEKKCSLRTALPPLEVTSRPHPAR